MLSDEQFFIWLKEGESEHLAFRPFFGHEAIETLVAFANLHGGVLLLGISELREIKGIPNAKESIDQWIHEIQIRTTPRLFPRIETIEVEGKTVVAISVAGYPVKPVASEGKYYKRTGKFNQEL
ncbi:MAG: ATP-binding protein, partial [Candidatus Azobacteroides sp.]|nr:ATP-binding protein [Candidatus Azobacteroides sp.]